MCASTSTFVFLCFQFLSFGTTQILPFILMENRISMRKLVIWRLQKRTPPKFQGASRRFGSVGTHLSTKSTNQLWQLFT